MTSQVREILQGIFKSYREYMDVEITEKERNAPIDKALQQLAEVICDEEGIYNIMKDHYWDSLQKDKEVILEHCKFLAKLICQNIREVIDNENNG